MGGLAVKQNLDNLIQPGFESLPAAQQITLINKAIKDGKKAGADYIKQTLLGQRADRRPAERHEQETEGERHGAARHAVSGPAAADQVKGLHSGSPSNGRETVWRTPTASEPD